MLNIAPLGAKTSASDKMLVCRWLDYQLQRLVIVV